MQKLKALLRFLAGLFGIRDAFMFGGLAVAARGIALVHEPAAWIFVGLVLMALALRGAQPREEPQRRFDA